MTQNVLGLYLDGFAPGRGSLCDREPDFEDPVAVLSAYLIVVDAPGEPEAPMAGAALVPIRVLVFGCDVQYAVVPRDIDVVNIESGEFEAQYELTVFLVQLVVVTSRFEELSRKVELFYGWAKYATDSPSGSTRSTRAKPIRSNCSTSSAS